MPTKKKRDPRGAKPKEKRGRPLETTATPDRKTILERTRKAFGSTGLRHLNDEQCVYFYQELQQLLLTDKHPHARILDWIHSLNIPRVEEQKHSTLRLSVRKAGNRLFGTVRDVRRRDAHRIAKAKAIKEEFNPIEETIRSVQKFRDEFDYWAKKSRERDEPNVNVAKLGTLYKDSVKDSVELFQAMKLIDEKDIEKARERVSIGSIQVMINQNDAQHSTGFLDKFLSRITDFPEITDGEQHCEAGIDTTDGEPGAREAITVEHWEGREDPQETDEDDGSLFGEPPEGDDGGD